MVDKVAPSITRMLADICYQVEENSHRDKQFLKEEIRNKKIEVKGLYADCSSTQKKEGTISFVSGIAVPVFTAAGSMLPFIPQSLKELAPSLIPHIGQQFTQGAESCLNGRVTSFQGNAQIGQKEMELFQTKLQDVGSLDHKAQEILREAQDSERRIITG
jgi:hypothetical protein